MNVIYFIFNPNFEKIDLEYFENVYKNIISYNESSRINNFKFVIKAIIKIKKNLIFLRILKGVIID